MGTKTTDYSDVPVGAAVYGTVGTDGAGHAGIYIGDDTVLSVMSDGTVKADTLEDWWEKYGGFAYSYGTYNGLQYA